MSLEVLLGGRKRRVDLRREGGRYHGLADHRSVDAEVIDRGPSSLLIHLNGRTFDVTFDSHDSGYRLDLGTGQVSVEILDPLSSSGDPSARRDESGKRDVRSAMPGKVVSVKVKIGDTVSRGQGLMVLEAMKMENEVPSPRAGKVVALGVAAGQTVEAGALLASVE